MATASHPPNSQQIGKNAGTVWRALDENGRLSYAKLVKLTGLPRDTVMQAVGWLAREDKLEIEETNRGRFVSLR